MKQPVVLMLLTLLAACGQPPAATPEGPAAPVIKVIATGASIAGANGIHFGPDGLLYIASVVGSDITVMDPESGAVTRRFTAADGVLGPDDIAFSSDGSFYWTSILVGEVAGFRPDGTKVVAAQLPPGPNPITFSNDDRLFVAQCFLGTGVYELDPMGSREPRLISDSLGPGCGLNGMDWGPDNRLYGPRWFVGEVVSFNVDDNTLRIEADGFATPAAVKFNSKGELHVLDTGRGEIVRVVGTDKTVVATLEPGLDNFAFDQNDRIFVSSFADGFIKRVNADGSVTTLSPGGMAHPGGITLFKDQLILADIHGIRGYDPATGEETLTQRNVVGMGAMGGAINLAADGDNLILTSWFDGDVRVWNPETSTRVAQYPGLSMPVAAVRYSGDIVVAEHGKQRVVALTAGGEERVIATGLPAPTGLVVEQGDLYLSDRSLGQILLIATNGKALPTPLVVADNLTTPEGFVVTDAGFVVVEADTGSITEVNSEGARRVLATIPPGTQAGSEAQPPSQVFAGIARVGKSQLFVTGETSRVLYRIDDVASRQ